MQSYKNIQHMHGASIVFKGYGFAVSACTVWCSTLGLCCCVTHRTSSNQYCLFFLQCTSVEGSHVPGRMREWWNSLEKKLHSVVIGHKSAFENCKTWRGNVTRGPSCLVAHFLTRSMHNPIRRKKRQRDEFVRIWRGFEFAVTKMFLCVWMWFNQRHNRATCRSFPHTCKYNVHSHLHLHIRESCSHMLMTHKCQHSPVWWGWA